MDTHDSLWLPLSESIASAQQCTMISCHKSFFPSPASPWHFQVQLDSPSPVRGFVSNKGPCLASNFLSSVGVCSLPVVALLSNSDRRLIGLDRTFEMSFLAAPDSLLAGCPFLCPCHHQLKFRSLRANRFSCFLRCRAIDDISAMP